MQSTNNIKTIGILALGLSSFASAGDSFTTYADTPIVREEAATGGFDGLKSIGQLYKNPDNPWFQEFTVFGRFQYQGAIVRGNDVDGQDFDDAFEEIRRIRIGGQGKFLNVFDFKANFNILSDGRHSGGDLDAGNQNFDEAFIGFNIKKAFGIDALDKLRVSYGRQKFALGYEATLSSKTIYTVERAAISNRVFGTFRPTSVKLQGKKDQWDFLLGVYSTEFEEKFLADWGESVAYQTSIGYQATENLKFTADVVFNDADDLDTFQYKWASSLSMVYDNGKWGVGTDLIYGDNGDEGNGQTNRDRQDAFWGVVILPHYWIIDGKLQAVARYQYQASDNSEGIRLNSRYVRDASDNINGGRGSNHHSIYAGLNYLFAGDNAKVLFGVEYDTLDTPDNGNVDALTWSLAVRTFF